MLNLKNDEFWLRIRLQISFRVSNAVDIDHSIQQEKENAAKMTNLDKSANFLKNDGQCYQYSKLYNVKIFLSKIQTLYISSSNFEKDKLMTVMISFHKIKIQNEPTEV